MAMDSIGVGLQGEHLIRYIVILISKQERTRLSEADHQTEGRERFSVHLPPGEEEPVEDMLVPLLIEECGPLAPAKYREYLADINQVKQYHKIRTKNKKKDIRKAMKRWRKIVD